MSNSHLRASGSQPFVATGGKWFSLRLPLKRRVLFGFCALIPDNWLKWTEIPMLSSSKWWHEISDIPF